jgi:hypothetical protein
MIQTKVFKDYMGRGRLMLHDTEVPTREAQLAMELVGRWGTVAGVPDGEDAAGRAKLRLMTPEELAIRACHSAEMLFGEMRRRGWIIQAPDISELDLSPSDE